LILVAGFAAGVAYYKHRQLIITKAQHEAAIIRVKLVAKEHGILDKVKAALSL
jgi:hypothetical protein